MQLSKEIRVKLVQEKEKLIVGMISEETTDEEYKDCHRRINDIDNLLEKDKKKVCFGISPDTMVVVGGNLLGLFLILNYERTEILTSKAIQFVLKGKP